MVCNKFYLDVVCTFLLKVFDNISCCGESQYRSDGDDEQKIKKRELKRKTRILLIRVTLGLIFNVAGFITICVVNKEIFIEGNAARGLFITIVVFLVMSYIITEIGVWIWNYHNDNPDNLHLSMIFYRLYEIEFDVLVFFYSLVLSDWEMTEFTTATTVLACSDTVINIIILGRNWYDYKGEAKCILIIIFLIFGVLLPPFLPIIFLIMIIHARLPSRFRRS